MKNTRTYKLILNLWFVWRPEFPKHLLLYIFLSFFANYTIKLSPPYICRWHRLRNFRLPDLYLLARKFEMNCIDLSPVYRNLYGGNILVHDDVIKWKRYWPFVRGIHRSPVNTPKGHWHEALMFSLICAWTNFWVNIWGISDSRRHRARDDVIIMNARYIP